MDAHQARDSFGTPVAQSDGQILKLFSTEHLPHALAEVSAPFGSVIRLMLEQVPPTARGHQFHYGVQKLLEAKDAFVRSVL